MHQNSSARGHKDHIMTMCCMRRSRWKYADCAGNALDAPIALNAPTCADCAELH